MVTDDYIELTSIFPLVKPKRAAENSLVSATVAHITVATSNATNVEIGNTVLVAKLFTFVGSDGTTRYFAHKNAIVDVE